MRVRCGKCWGRGMTTMVVLSLGCRSFFLGGATLAILSLSLSSFKMGRPVAHYHAGWATTSFAFYFLAPATISHLPLFILSRGRHTSDPWGCGCRRHGRPQGCRGRFYCLLRCVRGVRQFCTIYPCTYRFSLQASRLRRQVVMRASASGKRPRSG